MKINEYKTIKISPELHKIIKKYCDEHDYKLNNWIEKRLKKIIDELNDSKNN